MLGLRDEGATVARISASGRRYSPDAAHVQNIAQGSKAPECIKSCIDGVRWQQTGRLHLPSETSQYLFIEYRRRGAGKPLINHKTDRVRADVDYGYRWAVIEPAFDGGDDFWGALTPLRRGGV